MLENKPLAETENQKARIVRFEQVAELIRDPRPFLDASRTNINQRTPAENEVMRIAHGIPATVKVFKQQAGLDVPTGTFTRGEKAA